MRFITLFLLGLNLLLLVGCSIYYDPYNLNIINPDNVEVSSGSEKYSLEADFKKNDTSVSLKWSFFPTIGQLTATHGLSVDYIPPDFVAVPTKVRITVQIEGSNSKASTSLTVLPNATPTKRALPVPAATPLPNAPEIPNCSNFIAPLGTESLAAYSNQVSYRPGETMVFRVNAPNHGYAFVLYQEGLRPTLVYRKNNLLGEQQPLSLRPYSADPAWPIGLRVTVQPEWKSGLYRGRFIDLSNRQCFDIPLVIRPNPTASKPATVVLASNYTWEAYNLWGGGSFYRCTDVSCGSNTYAPIVRLLRPNGGAFSTSLNDPSHQHLALGTLRIICWLQSQGYDFDLLSDTDLDHDPHSLDGYRVLILDQHSEYWSTAMYDQLEAFIDAGHNVINWGGNQIYWKVVEVNGQLEVRKDSSRFTLVNQPAGLWRNLGRPSSTILGGSYSNEDYNTFAPYMIQNTSSFAFAGTGLRAGDSIGNNDGNGKGCSGWETEKIDPYSPSNLQVLARGSNPPNGHGADMVYFQRGKSQVFSVGSVAFMSCARDPVISQIMVNVMEVFTKNQQ